MVTYAEGYYSTLAQKIMVFLPPAFFIRSTVPSLQEKGRQVSEHLIGL